MRTVVGLAVLFAASMTVVGPASPTQARPEAAAATRGGVSTGVGGVRGAARAVGKGVAAGEPAGRRGSRTQPRGPGQAGADSSAAHGGTNGARSPGALPRAVTDAIVAEDGFYGGVDAPTDNEITLRYGRHGRQILDAYWRPSPRLRAGVVILHGGYWLRGDKSAWRRTARMLAARGFAAFSVDYRLSGVATWPAQRDDAAAALAFVKRNAARFDLDPERIVVLGSSSGGHLATMLGVYGDGGSRVAGVVAVSPVASPALAYAEGGAAQASKRQRLLRDATVQLLGCTPHQDPACDRRLEDSSAVHHVSAGDAPMFLVHSVRDFVPSRHSLLLAERLRQVGVPVDVRVVPGSAHGGKLLREPAMFESVVDWITRVTRT